MNIIVYSQNDWERCGHLVTASPVNILGPKRALLGTVSVELDGEIGCVYNETTKEVTHITLNFIARSNHDLLSEIKGKDSKYKIIAK